MGERGGEARRRRRRHRFGLHKRPFSLSCGCYVCFWPIAFDVFLSF